MRLVRLLSSPMDKTTPQIGCNSSVCLIVGSTMRRYGLDVDDDAAAFE